MQQSDRNAVLDDDALAELREDLGEAFSPFVSRFLENARGAIAQLGDEVRAADWESVAERAHGLKGSAAYLGAGELASGLGSLQRAAEGRAEAEAAAALARVATAMERVAPLLEARSGE